MDDHLVPFPEQALSGCPTQPARGTGDEDACHVLPSAAPLSSRSEYLVASYTRLRSGRSPPPGPPGPALRDPEGDNPVGGKSRTSDLRGQGGRRGRRRTAQLLRPPGVNPS